MTIRRAALAAALATAGIALLVAALAAWLLMTTGGLRFVWNRAASFAPDVQVQRLDGRLIGPLTIEGLELTTDSVRVTLERAVVEWEPLALLGRSFSVEALALRGLDVVLVPQSADAPAAQGEPFTLPDSITLPVDVNVDSITLDGAALFTAPDAEPLLVDSVSFSANLDGDQWTVHEIVVRAPLFDADGRLTVVPRGRYRSEVELDWVVRPPELPPAAGATVVSGDSSALVIEQRVAAPYFVAANVTVTEPLGALRLEGMLELRVDPAELGVDAGIATVAAVAAVEGPLDDLRLNGSADVPVQDLASFDVNFDARWTGDAVQFDALRLREAGSGADVELSGMLALRPGLRIDVAGAWSSLRWPLEGEPLVTSNAGTLRLTGAPEDLTAEFDAALAGGGADGTLRRADERIAADLRWRGIRWPESDPQLVSETGTLRVEGVLDDYRLTLDAGLALGGETGIAEGATGHVRLAGSGDRERLALEQVDVAALDGQLRGRGAFAWAPVPAAELDFTLRDVDPGVVAERWGGRLDGNVLGRFEYGDQGTLSVELDSLALSGELRDRTLSLDARGAYEDGDVRIGRLLLVAGGTTLDVSGTAGPQVDVEWRLDSPDLRDLWPDLVGRLEASGRAAGPRLRPVVDMRAEGAGIDGFGVHVEALRLAADVDLAGEGMSTLAAEIDALRFEGSELENLTLSASGNAGSHTVALRAAGEGAETGIDVTGSLERPWQQDYAWRFTLEQASLAYAELAPWSLREPASGRVSSAGTALDEACWQSGTATLCARAALQEGGTRASFALDALPFAYFSSFFPEGSRMTGNLGAEGELALLPDAPPRIEVDVTTSRGRIGSEVGGGVAGFAFGRGTGRFAWDGGLMEIGLDWPFEREQGRLELGAVIEQSPDGSFADSRIDGNFFVELHDLSFLPDLVPDVADTAGMIAGDIGLGGTVNAPQLVGRLELTGGTARLRGPGITLEEVRLALIGDGRGGVAVEAAGRSGGGVFQGEGRLNLEESVPVGFVEIRGEDFELIDTPDAMVYVTPDLRLGLERQRLQLTGEVVVPRASITPRGSMEGAIQPSQDQVFVDTEEPTPTATTRPLYAQVQIRLGDDVTFEGFGLTGRLAGALEVLEAPAEPTIGSGELRVEDGTYEAYGQELEIRRGRLIFAGGALTRPGLDIEAVRRPAENVLVGARVQGTLRRPELSVFSEPTMARQEQLSYLVLGRPLENASASENSALSQAATALGLRGGNFVSDRVNESLGFDEFGIQTQPGEDANSASFVIGKYLSPSLYVSYGVGLFQPVNTLRLRYTISSRWRLVTESSSRGSGGDVIYHIERGD